MQQLADSLIWIIKQLLVLIKVCYIKEIQNTQLGASKKMDNVNHPAHYGGADNVYEAIKVIEAWNLDFCLGNVVKYISRAGKKEGNSLIQDLEKAKWYLEKRIQELKDE